MAFIPKDVIEKLNELSCESVAEKLGVDVKHHKALCIAHDEEHPSMAFFGENRSRWYCFSCKAGGNAIKFVQLKGGLDFNQACEWLCEQFGIYLDHTSKNIKIKPTTPKHFKIKQENIVKPFAREVAQFVLNHCTLTKQGSKFLFDERKLDPEVIKSLNIVSLDSPWKLLEQLKSTFSEEVLKNSGLVNANMNLCVFTPCLFFPYYDVDGTLVGLQSRYLGENNKKQIPRFQFISAQKTRLFNLPVLNELKNGDDLYISEGITDCLSLLSSGKKALAIPSATILPKMDLMKLAKFHLHMYPDTDDAGLLAFRQLLSFFINLYTPLSLEELPEGVKEFSEYYIKVYGKKER